MRRDRDAGVELSAGVATLVALESVMNWSD